jgi:hypothetical protein
MHDDNAPNDSPFEPTVLAFFDVLGFSDRVSRIGLPKIYQQYQEIISIAKGKSAERIIPVLIPDGAGGLDSGLCIRTLQFAYFSDTIMIWVKYELPVVESFLASVLDFFCEALLRGLPMRACITFGEAIMRPQDGVFLGEPIIEAARGEQAQSWLGISFGPSVNQRRYGWLGSLKQVVPYYDHAKPGKESLVGNLVLDWPRRWRDAYSEHGSAIETLTNLNTDDRFTSYYDGALKLVEHSTNSEAWWETFDFKSKPYSGYIPETSDGE